MKKAPSYFLIIFFLLFAFSLWAISIEDQAKEIGMKLRCPVCKGIPIADSPAQLALDMMTTIHQKLEKAESEEEILSFFVERYGEWVLLNPKREGLNLIIWIFPIILLLGGLVFILVYAKKWSGQ